MFRTIYEKNRWGEEESRSGEGSSLAATANLRLELPGIIRRLAIGSILDAPCGDFHWMATMGIQDLVDCYHGVDIVPELIAVNQQKWQSDRVTFEVADIVRKQPRRADLILCRHLLIHLPIRDCLQVLRNFAASGSRYLLITDQPEIEENVEILWTGSFRPLNLSLPPFSLPQARLTVADVEDTSILALYEISAIAESLGSRAKSAEAS